MTPSSIFKAISIASSDMSLTLASLPSSFKDPGDDIEPIWIIQSNLLSRSLIQSHLQSPFFFFFLQYKVACGKALFCLPQSFTVYSSHSGQRVNCSEPPRYFSINFLLTVQGWRGISKPVLACLHPSKAVSVSSSLLLMSLVFKPAKGTHCSGIRP